MNAQQYLYPLIRARSYTFASAETLLVGQTSAGPIYLSERSGRVSPDPHLGQVQAGARFGTRLDLTRLQAGLDDRDRKVISQQRAVPGTPWTLLTTVDQAEVFGPLRRWAWMTAGWILGLVVLLALGMGLMVRQADARRILSQLAFERERKAMGERLSKALSISPDAISINRLRDGVYLDVNEGFTRITGYSSEELLGQPSTALGLGLWARQEDRDRLVAGLEAQGEVIDLEAPFRMKDGHLITGLMSAKILEYENEGCLLAVTRDITQRKQEEEERRLLQAQLHQAQKQESLGALAGGVAHDMNNVLGAILSLASGHRAGLDRRDPLATSFDTIINACLRGRGVVKSLLCFARKELEDTAPVDLNALVREVVQLLEHVTLKRISLETQLEEPLGILLGDASALNHAVMNLCVNAIDAMPGGGRLLVSTGNLGDGRVRLSVSDTGEGMTPEVQEKALEPFFTTKPVGKGSGLGLAMVFGTTKAHGGTLELHSQPGAGTVVTLCFPALKNPQPEPIVEPEEAGPRGADLKILLVDDDELIRASVGPMLQLLGHRVLSAGGGQEALDQLDCGSAVDLVILDMNMPGMDGAETLGHILARYPEQTVLLASGYSDGDIGALLSGRPNLGFLQKPFTFQELQSKLVDLAGTGV